MKNVITIEKYPMTPIKYLLVFTNLLKKRKSGELQINETVFLIQGQ